MLQRYCSDGSGKFEDGRANVKVDAKPYRRALMVKISAPENRVPGMHEALVAYC